MSINILFVSQDKIVYVFEFLCASSIETIDLNISNLISSSFK